MNPIEQLHRDRAQARANGDPYAELCVLATVGASSAPEARMLVLRDLDRKDQPKRSNDAGLAVFLNDSSPKWPTMDQVALVIYFATLRVQYRLACTTDPVPDSVVHSRWQERPEAPRKLDWYYQQRAQSSPIDSRRQLLAELEALHLTEPLTAPTSARGLHLAPTQVERLDLNQANGIHDRRRWSWRQGWRESVLVP